MREEIACELKLSLEHRRLAHDHGRDARGQRLRDWWKLLEAGQISMRYLYAFCDLTRALSDEQAQAVADRVIDRAGQQSIASFKRSLKRAVHAVAPTTSDEAEQDSVARRSVRGRESENGVSSVFAVLPMTDQVAVMTAVEGLARQWSAVEGETRTLEQLRADALVHLSSAATTAASARGRLSASASRSPRWSVPMRPTRRTRRRNTHLRHPSTTPRPRPRLLDLAQG